VRRVEVPETPLRLTDAIGFPNIANGELRSSNQPSSKSRVRAVESQEIFVTYRAEEQIFVPQIFADLYVQALSKIEVNPSEQHSQFSSEEKIEASNRGMSDE
jgi:hypothetical protein